MPAVIDTLLIELGLDTSKFSKSQKESVEALRKIRTENERNTKDIEYRAKAMAAAFASVKNEILGVLGVSLSAAGIAGFAKEITNSDAAVGRLAKNLGMATSELSAWEGMAEKFGGTAEDMDAAFRTVNAIVQNIHQFGTAGAAQGPLGLLFGKAGMTTGLSELMAAGKSGDVEKAMKLIQQAVSTAPDRGNALMLFQQAGLGEKTFNVLRDVGDQLERNLKLQLQNNVANERDAELAQERQKAISHLTDAFEKMGRAILNSKLLDLTKGLNDLADKVMSITNNPGQLVPKITHRADGDTGFLTPEAWDTIRGWFGLSRGNRKASGKDTSSGAGAASAPAADWRNDAQKARDNDAIRVMRNELSNESDPKARAALQREIDRMSFGGGVSLNLNSPVAQTLRAAGAASAAASAPSTTDVHIGTIIVQTQATDAKGIASKINSAVHDSYSFAAHANGAVQ